MSVASLHASAVELLGGWQAPNRYQDSLRHTMLAFLDARPDACSRSCAPGHITASALVLDHSRSHALLTLHPRVGAWIQLGGHCEPSDDAVRDAALREATEESGLANLSVSAQPVALHTHPITCSLGQPTRHLDVQFVAVASDTGDGGLPAIVRSDESVDLRWWPVEEMPEDSHRDEMADLVAAARGGAGRINPI